MERGMRLKVESSMVLHANRIHNIHDNGLDREYNRANDTGSKISSQLIHSTGWVNDYSTRDVGSNENYKLQQSQLTFRPRRSPPNSPSADDLDSQPSSGSSTDTSPDLEDYRSLSQSSDTDSDNPRPPSNPRGIVNPNYPGFQDFAADLLTPDSDEDANNINNNNNNNSVNNNAEKTFYDRPKFNTEDLDKLNALNIQDGELLKMETEKKCQLNKMADIQERDVLLDLKMESEMKCPLKKMADIREKDVEFELKMETDKKCPVKKMVDRRERDVELELKIEAEKKIALDKMADAFLSGVKEEIRKRDTNRVEDRENKHEMFRNKERVETENVKKARSLIQPANVSALTPPANQAPRTSAPRRSREKKRNSLDIGSFDVYNIETAMPVIDLDAIENHLKAAREEERKRRNDREEIRRRLATGDADEFYGGDRPGRKPSLQARLQSGMNLQICFMNDQMSDTESPSSDSEPPTKVSQISPMKQKQPSPLSKAPEPPKQSPVGNGHINGVVAEMSEVDVLVCVARLQTEARAALAQASDLAHLQMQMERQRRSVSPITEMLRNTLHKVGVVFPQDRRRVSRQMLTDMNIAQLQVIANDLHAQIETLNESLVKFLMERDELHMSQDSMLVDIEDLTRYLGAKENTFKEDISFNNNQNESKLPANRTARLVRK